MQTWVGATARRCPTRRKTTRAQRARVWTDGTAAGRWPEGQGEAMEMMEGATGGALHYVTYMNAAGKSNAEIARASIDYVKARDD